MIDLTAPQLVSFQKEAKATAKLEHPNIVRVLDFGASQTGYPFMVMDYIPGISLEKHLSKHGVVNPQSAYSIFSALAHALEYAHSQNIYHRDLKPSNIVLSEEEDGIKTTLIDFGIAKIKEDTGFVTVYQKKTLAGTPSYMAPDMINGLSYDQQSEVYCLGCVLYESLTGQAPFQGDTALEILAKHSNQTPATVTSLIPTINESLSAIVSKCLRKEKAERYKSMGHLKEELQKSANSASPFLEGKVPDVEPGERENVKTVKRLKPLTIAIIAMAGIGLILITLVVPLMLSKNESSMPNKTKDRIEFLKSIPIEGEYFESVNLQDSGYGRYKVLGQIDRKEQLNLLKEKPNLKGLSLVNDNLKGDVLEDVAKRPLTFLSLNTCHLDKKSFDHINRITTLNELLLYSCNIDQKENIRLNELNRLRTISLRNVELFFPLDSLRETKVKILSLLDSALTESDLDSIANINTIEELYLEKCNLEHLDLFKLSKLRKLGKLSLVGSAIDDESIKQLSGIKSIAFLSLRDNKNLTPKCLKYIPKMKGLRILSISNCVGLNDKHRLKKFQSEMNKKRIYVQYSQSRKTINPLLESKHFLDKLIN